MFALLITIAILTVLYSLAWHDQPAKERENARRANLRTKAHG
jgi:hypothetical protein